jgi:hypothetical protein
MPNPPNKNIGDLGKAMTAALQPLKEAAEKRAAAAAQAEQAESDETQSDSMTLLKPELQNILDKKIEWTWTTNFAVVAAYYYTDNDRLLAGSYDIELHLRYGEDDAVYISADESRHLAVALFSAARWESVWQQHVGEYLAVTKVEPPPPMVTRVEDMQTHVAVDGNVHRGPAHPCAPCDAMDNSMVKRITLAKEEPYTE